MDRTVTGLANALLQGARVLIGTGWVDGDVSIRDGVVTAVGPDLTPNPGQNVIPCQGLLIVPGFVDLHVHLREPGFSYKETIRAGTMAAARSGYTAVCAMANLDPVPDSREHLAVEQALIDEHAVIPVYPYGSLTVGQRGEELADLAGLAPGVIGFSDDGPNGRVTRKALAEAARVGRPVATHCEARDLLRTGWAIHPGTYADAHGLVGNSSDTEWREVERCLALVRLTGARFHVCHVSSAESVELIRAAKAEGLPVTAEAAPHHLLLTVDDLRDDGAYRMNPPLRTAADRAALRAGLADGTIDVVATDHAPHSAAEKSGGLAASANGIVGLETAFPVLYTGLVVPGWLTLERLIDAMSVAPRRWLGLGGGLVVGEPAELTVLDVTSPYRIDPSTFASLGRSTPFAGWSVVGRSVLTIAVGAVVWGGQ